MGKIDLSYEKFKEIQKENYSYKNAANNPEKEKELLKLKEKIIAKLNNGLLPKRKKFPQFESKLEFIEEFEKGSKIIEEKYKYTGEIPDELITKEAYANTLDTLEKIFKDFDIVDKNLIYCYLYEDEKKKGECLYNIFSTSYIDNFFKEHFDDFYVSTFNEIKEDIENYFTKELDAEYLQTTKRYFHEERLCDTNIPLTFKNFEEFVNAYFDFNESFDFDFFIEDGLFGLEMSFCSFFYENDKLSNFLSEHPLFMETYDYYGSDAINDAISECHEYANMCSELDNQFTKEYIKSLILKNKNYSFIKKEFDIVKKYDKKIVKFLKDMPSDYTDLFPYARLFKRHFTLHVGPTNSGKTYSAIEVLKKSKNGIYLAPLRLLAFEQFDGLNKKGFKCNLVTGEELENIEGATFDAATVEMLDITKEYETVIIDEAQMISDPSRGGAWTRAIVGAYSKNIHVCMSVDALDIVEKIIKKCGDDFTVINHERQTPLILENDYFDFDTPLKGDAYIVFSRKNVHAVAAQLKSMGCKCSIIYGSLPYPVRHEEARKFSSGETDVLVSTDAIGMGLNLPIRRIVFLENEKFDGTSVRELKTTELKQIAGRAGRRGIFDKGFVNFEYDKNHMKKILLEEVPKIEEAMINFPEELLKIDAPLSRIIEKWAGLDGENLFVKNLSEREIDLAKILEEYTNDKRFIYDFITIPFNEKDDILLAKWNNLAHCEFKKKEVKFEDFKTSIETIKNSTEMERAEKDYAVLDLLYQYRRKFGYIDKLDEIVKEKEKIANAIIQYLKLSKFKPKTCRECGKIMPWNHPYPMCEKCHDELYPRRNNEYWDDDFMY